MKKKTRGIVSVVAGLQLLAAAAVAQEAPIIARVVSYVVRPGMEQKFEDGMKRHNDFHVKQKDTRTHDMYGHLFPGQAGPVRRRGGGLEEARRSAAQGELAAGEVGGLQPVAQGACGGL